MKKTNALNFKSLKLESVYISSLGEDHNLFLFRFSESNYFLLVDGLDNHLYNGEVDITKFVELDYSQKNIRGNEVSISRISGDFDTYYICLSSRDIIVVSFIPFGKTDSFVQHVSVASYSAKSGHDKTIYNGILESANGEEEFEIAVKER